MSGKTAIQWTQTLNEDGTVTEGKTWNPIRGCTIESKGCQNCYAMRQAHRMNYEGGAYEGLTMMSNRGPVWNGELRPVPESLEKPLHWQKPTKIFVNSMSDLFHEDVSDEYIDKVFAVMAQCPQHIFQILTKRAERMHDYFSLWSSRMARGHRIAQHIGDGMGIAVELPLPNVHLGVSVENQETADQRIPWLLRTPAAIRWISAEPLLSDVHLAGYLAGKLRHLDWVVVGGESGPKARPFEAGWARHLIWQCGVHGVACYVKQLGAVVYDRNDTGFEGDSELEWPEQTLCEDWENDPNKRFQGAAIRVLLKHNKGGDMAEWPESLRVREYPSSQ